MSYVEENSKIWDERSENNDTWSVPVTKEMIQNAKEGNWSIVLTPTKPVPKEWFPENLKDKKILCLASGGGQWGQFWRQQVLTLQFLIIVQNN